MHTLPRRLDGEWRKYEPAEGERLTGRIVRLPHAGAHHGTRLLLRLNTGDVVGIPATAKRGWTVLERSLAGVQVGDTVEISFLGWRETADGDRRYRNVRVDRRR